MSRTIIIGLFLALAVWALMVIDLTKSQEAEIQQRIEEREQKKEDQDRRIMDVAMQVQRMQPRFCDEEAPCPAGMVCQQIDSEGMSQISGKDMGLKNGVCAMKEK